MARHCIDGIFAEGDRNAQAFLERWLPRLAPENVGQVIGSSTAGSDHVSFREAGIPTLTFFHQRLSNARTHHSTADTVRGVKEPDLRQASTVAAITAYLAATANRLWR